MSLQGPAGAMSAHKHTMLNHFAARRPFSSTYGLQRQRTSLRAGHTDLQRVHAKVQEHGAESMEDRKVVSFF